MIYKNGRTIETKVIKTTNKHTYVVPKNGYLEIRLSKYANLNDILKRIEPNFDKYERLTKYIPEDELMLWGKCYKLEVIKTKGFSYHLENGIIKVKSDAYLEQIKDLILKQELLNELKSITALVNKQIKLFGYQEVPIKVAKLKSKYGSYHLKKHEITLNSKLAHYDKIYLTYVLYHEYAHQKHPHHQKTFYQALATLFPEYKSVQAELKNQRIYQ
ncbi:MAG: YgjP-like metallopeptidase domain-containing protein [Acholeplasmataceae bacterium]